MKKRLISFLLVLAMCMSLCLPAFAEGEATVSGTFEEGVVTITGSGFYPGDKYRLISVFDKDGNFIAMAAGGAIADGSGNISATATTGDEEMVGGKIEVYDDFSNLIATGPIELSGKPETPTADFEASTMTMSGVDGTMQYSLDGGNTWIDIDGTSVILTDGAVTADNGIQVRAKGEGDVYSDIQTIELTQAARPSGVSKTDETEAKNDGALTGITAAMEYKLSGAESWTDGDGGDITGLAPGTYLVRTKGSGTELASEAVSLTIKAYSAPKPPQPQPETFTIKFDLNDGTGKVTELETDEDGKVTPPADPTRSGYTFLGWYTKAEGGEKVGSWTFEADATVYAHWSRNSSGGRPDDDRPSSGGGGSTSGYTISVPSRVTGGTVRVSPRNAAKGSTVTITVTPDDGYELDRLTVTDKDGKELQLTDKGDGKFTFTMPGSKVEIDASFKELGADPEQPGTPDTPARPSTPHPFTDVPAGEWYSDAVQYVYDLGMMTGMTPTTFGPDVTMNRGMIVTMLYRLEGEPSVGAASFTDVPSGEWYSDAVAWAKANNIVNGMTPTTFEPLTSITRQQMAAILYRYASYKGYDVGSRADLNGYTDMAQISSYAMAAMQWANAEGLITGTTPTTLDPNGNATRAQVATILMRFCENVAK